MPSQQNFEGIDRLRALAGRHRYVRGAIKALESTMLLQEQRLAELRKEHRIGQGAIAKQLSSMNCGENPTWGWEGRVSELLSELVVNTTDAVRASEA